MRLINADSISIKGIPMYPGGLVYIEDVLMKIEELPTVDAVPVVRDKGEWIPKEDSFLDIYYECSCCGGEFYFVGGTPGMNDYFFCPTCGADMRGDTNV